MSNPKSGDSDHWGVGAIDRGPRLGIWRGGQLQAILRPEDGQFAEVSVKALNAAEGRRRELAERYRSTRGKIFQKKEHRARS